MIMCFTRFLRGRSFQVQQKIRFRYIYNPPALQFDQRHAPGLPDAPN
jgi:hypothetical protein